MRAIVGPKSLRDLPESPCLVLDLDVFDRNVARIASAIIHAGGKRWRPHVKAIRAPVLARRLAAAGASGVTVSTLAQAQAMVQAGIDDVLIASNVVGRDGCVKLAQLNRAARVLVCVDAPAHIDVLASAARSAGVVIPVLVEVDVGLQRAGVAPGEAALHLGRHIGHAGGSGLSFCGLMAWEGHTTRIADPLAKEQAVRQAVALLTDTARLCREGGLPVDIVSCGGTGTYAITSRLPGVSEVQAGGGVFGDLHYRDALHVPHEKTPGRSQVFLHPLGGPGEARVGGSNNKTPGRSQVFLHPLGGPGEARVGGSNNKTPGRSQVFLHPLGGPGEARVGGALEPALFLRATVLSRPTARRIVCDAGWRYHGIQTAMAQVVDLPGVVHMAPAAEHLTLECRQDVLAYAVGERIDLAVGYADSTVFLHRRIFGLRKGVLVEVLALPQAD